jgi:hypothetical protein
MEQPTAALLLNQGLVLLDAEAGGSVHEIIINFLGVENALA